MVYTAHDRKRVDRRRECRADAPGNGDEPLYSDEYPLFESGEDGTENSKGEIAGRKNCYQRGNKEVDHFGNDLVQPFFEERHEPDGYDDRYDVTLVARQVDFVKTEPDVGLRYRFSCFDHTGDRPRVDQVGMDHYHAYDRAEEDVAAEYARRRDSDEYGQEYECSVTEEVEDLICAGGCHFGTDLGHALEQTHDQTCRDDGGKDGNEYVAQRLYHAEGQGLFCGCRRLDVRLCGGCHAADGQELVINLVDGTCTEDDLQLTVRAEYALYAVDILEFFHVYLAVVVGDETQPGSTVCSGHQIISLADEIIDFLRTFAVIHTNTPLINFDSRVCTCLEIDYNIIVIPFRDIVKLTIMTNI